MEERAAEAIDIRKIMEEIHRKVSAKMASGFYSEEEIEEISRMELSLEERQGFGEEMDRLLSWLHTHWESTGPVDPIPEAKSPLLRRAVKRLLHLLMRPEARLLLAKQNQINAKLVQLLSGALPPLRDGYLNSEQQLENLSSRLAEEQLWLRERVDELAARLERLEGGRGRAESGGTETR